MDYNAPTLFQTGATALAPERKNDIALPQTGANKTGSLVLSPSYQSEKRDFKLNKNKALIATEIDAQDIDATNLTHVINIDMLQNPKDYTPKLGCTKRARNEQAMRLYIDKSK